MVFAFSRSLAAAAYVLAAFVWAWLMVWSRLLGCEGGNCTPDDVHRMDVSLVLTTTSLAGVNEYQTVCCAPQKNGSPGSVVASERSTESVNGNEIAVALAKLSFVGGAASALGGEANAVKAKAAITASPKRWTLGRRTNRRPVRVSFVAIDADILASQLGGG